MRPRALRRRLALMAFGAILAGTGIGWGAGEAHAEVFAICPSSLTGVVTPDTSCAFADDVRAAWYTQPGSTVIAYSPVTDRFYTMQCQPWPTDTWYGAKRCWGVNAFGAVLIVYVA